MKNKKLLMVAILLATSLTNVAQATDTRSSSCDFGWNLTVKNGTDLCKMRTPWGTITGQYTIPAGTSGLAGNPRRHGWKLLRDFKRSRDYWRK